jgi:chromosomal replication initiation ATPase DnaA
MDDSECEAANLPIVLLDGEAGVGKSHLLADVVENRRKEGRYSLFSLVNISMPTMTHGHRYSNN